MPRIVPMIMIIVLLRLVLPTTQGADEARQVLGAAGIGTSTRDLGRAVAHPTPSIRRAATTLLCSERDASSLGALRGALGDRALGVQLQAAQCLSTIRDKEAITTLKRLLHAPLPDIRAAAASSLAEAGFTDGLHATMQLLDSPDWQQRIMAPMTLIHFIGTPRRKQVLEAFSRCLLDTEPVVRVACVNAMPAMGPVGRDLLRKSVHEDDPLVRKAIRRACPDCAFPVEVLQRCLREPESVRRADCVLEIRQSPFPEASALLEDAKRDPSAVVRRACLSQCAACLR